MRVFSYNIRNMIEHLALIQYLSNGDFHSGEDLASQFQVSRTAIWKQIKKINTLFPIEITSIPGKGYKMHPSMVVLNQDAIVSELLPDIRSQISKIEVMLSCASTNQYLLEHMEQHEGHTVIALSEIQTDGRGRRGRQWHSPFGRNIYMSVARNFDCAISELSGLSLVIAISLAESITALGVDGVTLKWPNDIYVRGSKLAGVLLELRGESNSPCRAVIGIGINVNMPALSEHESEIDQSWIDISQLLGAPQNRNQIVARIINDLIKNLVIFENEGFEIFMERWKDFDFLKNKAVNIHGALLDKSGIARGIDQHGALLVEIDGNIEPVFSGEVSIRLQA